MAQAYGERDVRDHLQELALPILGERFDKMPHTEVREVAEGRVPVSLLLRIVMPVARDALAQRAEEKESKER